MAHGTKPMLISTGRPDRRTGTGGPRRLRGDLLLAAVAGAFTVAQLLLVGPAMGLGWDEIVYVSQVSADRPAAFFSAPRSRGVSLLVWPIASWSSSTVLLRVYLAVLSGLGLYLALRVWRGLFPARVLAGAGAFFVTLWITMFYGPQAMPNLWVAFGALICVGCFLRVSADRFDTPALWGVVGGAALMAWMRPTDAVWVTLPLLVLVAVRRRWRLGAALAGGLAAGGVEWVVEAFLAFGGLRERLNEASRIQGDLGWNIAVDDQMRSLMGSALCRPCGGELPDPGIYAWWLTLPVLAGYGLFAAVRAGRTERTLLPLACATTAAVPYLFLIGYAAPRFLLPAYALLAIPVVDALFHLAVGRNGRPRPVALAVIGLALIGHLGVQYSVLDSTVDRTTKARIAWARSATELHRLGVRPPCLLTGEQSIPIAFYAGCTSGAVAGHNADTSEAAILDTARHTPVAALSPRRGDGPSYARTWELHHLPRLDARVAPLPGAGGPG
ncbi:hypothetical protein ABZ869_29815 [Streptomyces sp. NPDC046928]|uniref:hypothetical protein n=1 Tax=Streptomyces TaxID=1883 RepID=UPI0033EE8BC5